MKTFLVYRFSSMGDVALILPVLQNILRNNEDTSIFLVTRKQYFPIFQGIERLHLIHADLNGRHKGLQGLVRLHSDLSTSLSPTAVIDLHQVIRSRILNFLFRINGIQVVAYDKGRKEKNKAIRTKNIPLPLPHTTERYLTPFKELGLRTDNENFNAIGFTRDDVEKANFFKQKHQIKEYKIALAPFAGHPQKIWGINKIRELIFLINQNIELSIYLTGGGKYEEEILHQLSNEFSNCIVLANQLDLGAEFALLSEVHLGISMDSSNLHLFSLLKIPTISIWGPTDPKLGFAPLRQSKNFQIFYSGDQITCRPCSVYGNKPCIHDSLKCMDYITPEQVLGQILNFFGKAD